jgi:hypothetical protein
MAIRGLTPLSSFLSVAAASGIEFYALTPASTDRVLATDNLRLAIDRGGKKGLKNRP